MGLFVRQFGLKKTMLVSTLVYLLGCIACGVATSMPVFLIGRFVQGCGGGGLVALVFIAQNELFPNRFIPRIVACNSVVWMTAAFSGPMIGGLFATYGFWRFGYLFFACQAFILIFVILRQISVHQLQGEAPKHKVSAFSIVVLLASILCVCIAGTQEQWYASIGFVVIGIAGLFGFIVIDQQRQSARMLPAHMLKLSSPVTTGLIMTLVFSISLMSFVVYGPIILIKVYGLSPLMAGFVLITEALAWSTTAVVFAGRAPDAEARLVLVGSALVTAGVFLQGLVVPATSVFLIVVVLTIACGGFGTQWGYLIRRVVDEASVEDKQRASSILPVVQQIGFALGAAIAGLTANRLGFSELSTATDMQRLAPWIFFAFVPFAIIGNVASWLFVKHLSPAAESP